MGESQIYRSRSTRDLLPYIAAFIAATLVLLVAAVLFYKQNPEKTVITEKPFNFPTITSQTTSKEYISPDEFGHQYSFTYPASYVLGKGSRPFNANDEGTSETAYVNCVDKDTCPNNTKNTFSVTIYENRQDWDLTTWMAKSVYAPQNSCQSQDSRAKIVQKTFLYKPSYEFHYLSDKEGANGCKEVLSSDTNGEGQDTIFMNGQTVYVLSVFSSNPTIQQELMKSLSSFKILP